MRSEVALKGMKVARTPQKRKEYAEKYKDAKLTEDIQACTRCSLSSIHGTPIPHAGFAGAEVKFVTHRPDAWDRRRTAHMAGRSGSLFKQEAVKVGWKAEDAALVYQICCEDPLGEHPESAEMCQPNYERQLGKSWLVGLIGRDAFEYQFKDGTKDYDWQSAVGNTIWHDQRVWFVIRDLDWYLEGERRLQLTAELHDMRQLFEGGKLPISKRDEFKVNKRSIRNKMNSNGGWVHIWSSLIEDEILVMHDNSVSVPHRFKDLPHFTLDEIVRLKGIGKTGWKAVAEMKKTMGGTILR